MLNTTTYFPKLKQFEGSIPFMYLDTAGNVTVGVGNLLPNAGTAKQLAFVRRADATAATGDDIQADFDNVDDQTAGKLANFYKQFTKLDLPEAAIDALLAARVAEFTLSLRNSFPDFPLYPEEVCAALFDMAFNLGLRKLTTQFPTFCGAIRDEDWATASAECKRGGIQDARNIWTKAQFDKADADSELE